MRRILMILGIGGLISASAGAAQPVDMELMTYPEIAAAMRAGKTTVLIYNGGTEQRGPHAVLGGHSLIARRVSVEIARQLGNALVAPVLPFSIAEGHLNPKWPGSVNLPGPVFSAVNEAVVDSMVVNSFKNIVLMGDHGGGQVELRQLSQRLNNKYAPRGTHVYFCGDVYAKTRDDVDAWIKAHGLPPAIHGGIHDTSLLMYLGGDTYVRRDKLAAGAPVLQSGQPPDRSKPPMDNGVIGDPRRSTPEMGKVFFDIQVRNAVEQIRSLLSSGAGAQQRKSKS
jgi:creatinine amidohydrolase/Fe(II)-dependent formamide hydrolase-like protein